MRSMNTTLLFQTPHSPKKNKSLWSGLEFEVLIVLTKMCSHAHNPSPEFILLIVLTKMCSHEYPPTLDFKLLIVLTRIKFYGLVLKLNSSKSSLRCAAMPRTLLLNSYS